MSAQLELFAEPPAVVTDVTLGCPGCGYTWLSAQIVQGAWWAEGMTPEKVAQRPWCPACGHQPPMQVVR